MSDDKKSKTFNYMDDETKTVKTVPEKPGFLDTIKEGFESNATRAQINAIRRRREQYGS